MSIEFEPLFTVGDRTEALKKELRIMGWIACHEGAVLGQYTDSRGFNTFGIGHLVTKAVSDAKYFRYGGRYWLSKGEYTALLAELKGDIATIEKNPTAFTLNEVPDSIFDIFLADYISHRQSLIDDFPMFRKWPDQYQAVGGVMSMIYQLGDLYPKYFTVPKFFMAGKFREAAARLQNWIWKRQTPARFESVCRALRAAPGSADDWDQDQRLSVYKPIYQDRHQRIRNTPAFTTTQVAEQLADQIVMKG